MTESDVNNLLHLAMESGKTQLELPGEYDELVQLMYNLRGDGYQVSIDHRDGYYLIVQLDN